MKRLLTLFVALAPFLNAESGHACSAPRKIGPKQLVAESEVIVRATAIEYVVAQPGTIRTTGVGDDTKVRFRIESVLKGTYAGAEDLALKGHLSVSDDWNDKGIPHTFVRPDGRGGGCVANTYKTGGQFVLLLKRGPTSNLQGGTEYTVSWAALAPLNEQVRSADDPWVQWVKEEVQRQGAKDALTVVLRSKLQWAVSDPGALAAIQKKMDEIDFWDETRFATFPVLFVLPNNTCDSKSLERIELMVIRGTTVKNLLWLSSACPKAADFKPAQDLLDLIGLIKQSTSATPFNLAEM